MAKRYRLILFLVLIFLDVCGAVFAEDPSAADGWAAFQEAIYQAVNQQRVKYHVGEVLHDKCLDAAAQRQAEYLAEIGKLTGSGRYGESLRERVLDSGYGGDESFTVRETNAQIWVDTDVDYLMEWVWHTEQTSVKALFSTDVRQIGIGIADAPDKHRYVVAILAGLDDGSDGYAMTRPTYDYRTPKPTASVTPSPEALITSTPNPDGGVYHVVREGETFSEIALAYGLDWYTLSVLNHIKLSDSTPVVIMEGQVLVIEPTFTLTPTPTDTKTPLPPTGTPRPTFTSDPAAAEGTVPTAAEHLPEPNWDRLVDRLTARKNMIGWILICLCVPGILLSFRKKK